MSEIGFYKSYHDVSTESIGTQRLSEVSNYVWYDKKLQMEKYVQELVWAND